jgi:hypothetical protein
MDEARIRRIIETLWEPDETGTEWTVFALLDAARDPRVFAEVSTSGLPHECLFAGKVPRTLAKAAPYIVELDPRAGFTRRLLEQGWGRSWGVFVSSDARLEELRKHFRTFLKVKDQRTGRSVFFRYYDPRVLRVYLPTCSSDEIQFVLNPLRYCFVESEDGSRMIRFHVDFPVELGGECRLRARLLILE